MITDTQKYYTVYSHFGVLDHVKKLDSSGGKLLHLGSRALIILKRNTLLLR
jgi:hypothetical protein